MTATPALPEGWGWPGLSKKAHYFVGATSLCNRWLFTGYLEPDDKRGPDDCAACVKKLDKRAKERIDAALSTETR